MHMGENRKERKKKKKHGFLKEISKETKKKRTENFTFKTASNHYHFLAWRFREIGEVVHFLELRHGLYFHKLYFLYWPLWGVYFFNEGGIYYR